MIKKIKRFLNKTISSKTDPIREGRLYDLRHKSWGHSIEFLGKGKRENSFRIWGWLSPHAKKGDLFLHPARKGLAVFQLLDIDNCSDPRDMFFAETGIIRYATEEDLAKE